MQMINDMELNMVTGGSTTSSTEDKSMEQIDKAAETVAKGIFGVLRALHFICTLSEMEPPKQT